MNGVFRRFFFTPFVVFFIYLSFIYLFIFFIVAFFSSSFFFSLLRKIETSFYDFFFLTVERARMGL